jgi:hypothetical protein
MPEKKPDSPSVPNEINRALFLNPDTIGDLENDPLLDVARKNVETTNYADEATKDNEFRRRKNEDG